MFFRNDCSSQQCVATLFSRHPHDDGDACLRHLRDVSCVEDVVGKLWIGKASRAPRIGSARRYSPQNRPPSPGRTTATGTPAAVRSA